MRTPEHVFVIIDVIDLWTNPNTSRSNTPRPCQSACLASKLDIEIRQEDKYDMCGPI